jgi:hypothetical protein
MNGFLSLLGVEDVFLATAGTAETIKAIEAPEGRRNFE